ncbi:MAG: hypothetical protein V1664_03485 [Candidatus Uhrbacteria bacterium]
MNRWILLLILLLSCGFVRPVFAIGIAPATIELTGDPGSVLKQEITVINTKDAEQTYYLNTRKFTAQGDESGTPKFVPSEENSDLVNWLSFSSQAVIVPARSFAKIPFSISVPFGTPAGSYFVAVTVAENPSEIVAANGATIQAETASLIFLTVNGETNLAGQLLDFQVDPVDTNQILSTYKYRVQNQGNVYFAPQGTITLKDIFGRTILTADANQQAGRILPNSTRTFNGVLGQNNQESFFTLLKHQFSVFTAGPITAYLEINIGESGPTITATDSFWYIPWELFSMLILAILIILIAYGLVRMKTKK